MRAGELQYHDQSNNNTAASWDLPIYARPVTWIRSGRWCEVDKDIRNNGLKGCQQTIQVDEGSRRAPDLSTIRIWIVLAYVDVMRVMRDDDDDDDDEDEDDDDDDDDEDEDGHDDR